MTQGDHFTIKHKLPKSVSHGVPLPAASDPEGVWEGVSPIRLRLPDSQGMADRAPDRVQTETTLLGETGEGVVVEREASVKWKTLEKMNVLSLNNIIQKKREVFSII